MLGGFHYYQQSEESSEIYPALKSFFLSEEKCPVMLKKWFSDPCTLLWMNFAHATLPLFHDVIIKTEGEDVAAVESSILLSSLIEKLNCRKKRSSFHHQLSNFWHL